MARNPHEVLATRETRVQLPAMPEHFREAGSEALAKIGEGLGDDEAMELAASELRAMRSERRARQA